MSLRRIFVDIGSHEGQTLQEVVKPRWEFDRIYAVEPMPRELAILEERYGADPRVTIVPLALSDCTGDAVMYGTNDALEASLFPAKEDVDAQVETQVQSLDATEFFRDIPEGRIFVDLNAEGAEIPILWSLCRSGQIHRIKAMLMSFDIRFVPGLEAEETHIAQRMYDIGFDRYTSTYPDRPNHQAQIATWLEGAGLPPD